MLKLFVVYKCLTTNTTIWLDQSLRFGIYIYLSLFTCEVEKSAIWPSKETIQWFCGESIVSSFFFYWIDLENNKSEKIIFKSSLEKRSNFDTNLLKRLFLIVKYTIFFFTNCFISCWNNQYYVHLILEFN